MNELNRKQDPMVNELKATVAATAKAEMKAWEAWQVAKTALEEARVAYRAVATRGECRQCGDPIYQVVQSGR